MMSVDPLQLTPGSAYALVAHSSQAEPDFVLADRASPRFVVARWRRRGGGLGEAVTLPEHIVSYCAEGTASTTVTVGGRALRIRQQPGSVLFIPAGLPVQWRFQSAGVVEHVHLYVSAAALRPALVAARGAGDAGDAPGCALLLHDAWLDGFFRLLMAEYEACGDEGRLQDFDLLERNEELLLRRIAARLARAGGRGATESRTRVAPLRPALLRQLDAYMDGHLGRLVPLAELAAQAGLSVDHFARSFARATGTTPHRYLLERRLDRACERLKAGREPVATIAREAGFASTAHFSAAFRRHRGTTPSDYRRQR